MVYYKHTEKRERPWICRENPIDTARYPADWVLGIIRWRARGSVCKIDQRQGCSPTGVELNSPVMTELVSPRTWQNVHWIEAAKRPSGLFFELNCQKVLDIALRLWYSSSRIGDEPIKVGMGLSEVLQQQWGVKCWVLPPLLHPHEPA